MKLFITGGSGFIGSSIIKKLLELGFSIKALEDTTLINISHKNLEKIQGNIIDINLTEHIRDIDVFIHAAAYIGTPKAKEKQKFYRVNVEGTKNIVNQIKGKNIKFLYLSTSAVFYSEMQKDWYAHSKFLATEFVKSSDISNPVIVYPTNVIDVSRYQIGKIIFAPSMRIGRGERVVNFVDLSNFTESLIKIASTKETEGEYIIGGVNLTAKDYLKKMSHITKSLYLPLRIPRFIARIIVFLFFGKGYFYYLLSKKDENQKIDSKRMVEEFNYCPEKNLEFFLDS